MSRAPFARMVREGMAARGMGLRELCRAADLDPSFLSKVLAGKRSPPSEEDVLRRVAAALGLDEPAMVVAAGRIPREWARLSEDDGLFRSVHGLVSGRAPAAPMASDAALPRGSARSVVRKEAPPERPREIVRHRALSEELL